MKFEIIEVKSGNVHRPETAEEFIKLSAWLRVNIGEIRTVTTFVK